MKTIMNTVERIENYPNEFICLISINGENDLNVIEVKDVIPDLVKNHDLVIEMELHQSHFKLNRVDSMLSEDNFEKIKRIGLYYDSVLISEIKNTNGKKIESVHDIVKYNELKDTLASMIFHKNNQQDSF